MGQIRSSSASVGVDRELNRMADRVLLEVGNGYLIRQTREAMVGNIAEGKKSRRRNSRR